MAFDTARARRWVVRTIKADGTIRALLAGEGAYRGSIPRDLDTTQKPAIAVHTQADGPPSLPWMIRGHAQWHDTPSTVQTKISMQTDDETALEPVADRLDVILDGVYDQSMVHDGVTAKIYHCRKGIGIPEELLEGDAKFQVLTVFWHLSAKVQ